MSTWPTRFIRWGTAFLVLGLWTGYGPFHHYLHGDTEPSCPFAPVHGHVTLLGWIGLTLFGLVYHAIGAPAADDRRALLWIKVHFWMVVVGVLGVLVNGIFGYEILDRISPGFYYTPDAGRLRLWFSIDGLFLSLYGLGCLFFLLVVFRTTPSKG